MLGRTSLTRAAERLVRQVKVELKRSPDIIRSRKHPNDRRQPLLAVNNPKSVGCLRSVDHDGSKLHMRGGCFPLPEEHASNRVATPDAVEKALHIARLP